MSNTKRALFLSAVSMLLCIVMLAGTTFAWFTDSVESTGNIIKTGTLKVDLIHANYPGNTGSPTKTSLKDNPDHVIFDYELWEPGYTQIEYFQVINQGNLNFEYEFKIKPNGTLTKLADVIDVYYSYPTVSYNKNRADALASMKRLGTLADIVNNEDGTLLMGNTGGLIKDTDLTTQEPVLAFAIALHMQESANNDYQTLPLVEGGAGAFNVGLYARQMEQERDSFGSDYDRYSEYDYGNGTTDPDATPDTATVKVTPADIDTIDFKQDGKVYKFEGTFDSDVIIASTSGLTQTFDGSAATVNGRVELLAPGVLGSYGSLTGTKSGDYTVTGFSAEQINVFAYDTTVNIEDNKTEFIHVNGGNVAMNITGNTVDANFTNHNPVSNKLQNDSEYGVYLAVVDYTLKFDGNTITDANSHAFGINGCESDHGEGVANTNAITSFSGNDITVNGPENNRVAIKIWDDETYAPAGLTAINTNAQALVDIINAGGNTVTPGTGEYTYYLYDFYTIKPATPLN
ncbi:MAG: hypothetical protein IJ391_04730 [Clostridia bacterium]|nr:hypothetical protein [Clostridia bacterium]